MEVIRAPWRMSYINEASGQTASPKDSCFFCRYTAEDNDAENLVVTRGTFSFVVMNRFPYSSGHLMVVPYQHTANLSDLHPEEYAEIFSFAQKSTEVLREIMHAEGFNLGMNIGKIAGAGVDSHLHLHVVPRWNGDTNFMSVTAETKVLPEALSETYKRLRTAWR